MTNKSISTQTKAHIIQYFEGAGLDYYEWSKSFNMHFGYYEWGKNPFDLEGLLNNMNAEVLKRLKLEDFEQPLVLDLGCGLGTSSRFMAERCPEATFYGLTITPWQVKFGSQLTKDAQMDRQVQHLCADYTNIPMADKAVEAAFAMESACYAKGPDKKDFLEELYRVLKPGGHFVISDGFRKHSRPLPKLLNKIYRTNMKCWALNDLADIDKFLKRMREIGFRNIEVEDASWKVAPSFAHVPWITLKFLVKQFWKGTFFKLSRERKNNTLAPILGLLMGASRPHFSYYIITGEK